MNTNNLVKYAKNGYNVLLSGRHGVGKTHIIKEVFSEVFGEYYTNWRYFSASTLDPWVDFIGIPKNYEREDGTEVFGIIPPEHFTGQENVKAIFFDEINRADEKTLNALMELIQFKSINGRKYPHLECVWAAENPADDDDNDYSVQALDPAQKDRFNVQINVPFAINKKYFEQKFDTELVKIAKNWWDNAKKKISPRKLEDLLTAFIQGFNIQDFTNEVNVKELQKSLNSIGNIQIMKSVISSGEASIREYFTMDVIRENASLIRGRNEILGKVYDVVDGEVKAYLTDELGYVKRVTAKDRNSIKKQLNEEQSQYFDYLTSFKKRDKRLFISTSSSNQKVINYKDFYIHASDFVNTFAGVDVDFSYVLDELFPYIYSTNLSTPYIEKMVDEFVTNKKINLVRRYFNVWVHIMSKCSDRNTVVSSNPYQTIKKMIGCHYVYRKFNYNKAECLGIFNKIKTHKTVTKSELDECFKIDA